MTYKLLFKAQVVLCAWKTHQSGDPNELKTETGTNNVFHRKKTNCDQNLLYELSIETKGRQNNFSILENHNKTEP